ncbi:MAG: hypothetical protein ACFFCZ_27085 [Promethearchaeota archaeon]
MKTIQSGMKKLSLDNLKVLIIVSCTLLVSVPFLAFICMFAHEGGHGIIIVPAILLNGEIPEVPSAGMQENPFRNFPLGILSLFFAFPLGIIANGALLYLSYKNARINRNYKSKKELLLLIIFMSFCILNFGAILTNFFGADFSFIIKDALKLPADEQWFRSVLRIITYLVFPVVLAAKKEFEMDKMLVISLTTYLTNLIVVEVLVPPLSPILMANFWWLFIIGLPVLTGTIGILILNYRLAAKGSKAEESTPSQPTTLNF